MSGLVTRTDWARTGAVSLGESKACKEVYLVLGVRRSFDQADTKAFLEVKCLEHLPWNDIAAPRCHM